MRNKGVLGARGLLSALVLAGAGSALAWLCVRTAIVGILPPTAPAIMGMAPNAPTAVLGRALIVLGKRLDLLAKPQDPLHTTVRDLDPVTLAAVRRAAADAPLDARSFLILGYHQLATDEPAGAIKSLEAGQRLNPRDRLIHLLLLERYLRANEFAKAAEQFSVLARLVGGTQPAIAAVMAQMVMDPSMRDAARQTLRTDPNLERAVLIALARSESEPDSIFALASPGALADMGHERSWGPVLVSRLVEAGRFQAARAVWRRVYRLPDNTVASLIFNPLFRKMPASPPFNWTLVASGLGAADPHRDALSVDYYGRDSGDLAGQMLVIAPGRYRLAFKAEGGTPNTASHLFWTVACAGRDKAVLANVAVPTAPGAHRATAVFTVPATCPAQTLTLRGEAGEFPSPVSLTIGEIAIQRLTETTS